MKNPIKNLFGLKRGRINPARIETANRAMTICPGDDWIEFGPTLNPASLNELRRLFGRSLKEGEVDIPGTPITMRADALGPIPLPDGRDGYGCNFALLTKTGLGLMSAWVAWYWNGQTEFCSLDLTLAEDGKDADKSLNSMAVAISQSMACALIPEIQ